MVNAPIIQAVDRRLAKAKAFEPELATAGVPQTMRELLEWARKRRQDLRRRSRRQRDDAVGRQFMGYDPEDDEDDVDELEGDGNPLVACRQKDPLFEAMAWVDRTDILGQRFWPTLPAPAALAFSTALPPALRTAKLPAPTRRDTSNHTALASLCLACFEYHQAHGTEIDIEHPLSGKVWPLMNWLRMRLESTGFEWNQFFYDQEEQEREGGVCTEWGYARLPAYNEAHFDEAVPLLNLLEVAWKCLSRQKGCDVRRVQLPEDCKSLDVSAGGGLKMKARRPGAASAETVLQALIWSGQTELLAPPWREVLAALAEYHGHPFVEQEGDYFSYALTTGPELAWFIDRAERMARLRAVTDTLIVQFFDAESDNGGPAFWPQFMGDLNRVGSDHAGRAAVEAYGRLAKERAGAISPKRTRRRKGKPLLQILGQEEEAQAPDAAGLGGRL